MTATAPRPTLTWDIFCHVIDNWGDLGVCWRLGTQLAGRGQRVRLWVDDPTPLAWMAPGAREGHCAGITVHPWPRTAPEAPSPELPPGDVLIEAFGCEIAPAWVQALHPPTPQPPNRVWLNLEYLSAEPYVQRSHRLPSPVLSGPLVGRTKWFFYPGFTPGTGGLLREPDLLARQRAFEPAAWLQRHGVAPGKGAPVVGLFCYEPPALPALLRLPALAQAHWLVATGRTREAVRAAWGQGSHPSGTRHELPALPQAEFDHLLWASDLNMVRGEDSLVRALWAGRPLVWHIYPQHDDAHHAKLEAFLDWLQAPASLRHFHRVWNGIESGPLPLPDLPAWAECVIAARDRLLTQDDLVTQLLRFVDEKR